MAASADAKEIHFNFSKPMKYIFFSAFLALTFNFASEALADDALKKKEKEDNQKLRLENKSASKAKASEATKERERNIDAISDNAFIIEEAYNQEAGIVQHITTA